VRHPHVIYSSPSVYDSWYPLECKPGQKKTEYRGELEVKIGFTVRASESVGGSVADLTKKNKGSISSLNKVAGNIGGSLLSLGGKEKKNFKKIAASVSSKVEKVGSKAKKSVSSLKLNKDRGGLDSLPETQQWNRVMMDGVGASFPNEDPGVNSDDEDDMFQFDTLSYQSSHSSLATSKLGTVSTVNTPLQGSLERGNQQIAPSDRLGDWETKLLGYKTGLHVAPAHDDALSMTSILSASSNATTLDTWTPYRQYDRESETAFPTNTKLDKKEHSEQNSDEMSSLPSYNEVMDNVSKGKERKSFQKEGKNFKKKIIPVVSDSSESSPSPEEPSSPVGSPRSGSLSFRFSNSKKKNQMEIETMKDTLSNSFSFRERKERNMPKNSDRSTSLHHSRTFSNGSQGPPHGTRIVLGRETSPVPSQQGSKIPKEIMEKFGNKSREDLIEMVVMLQGQVDDQGRKVGDMEEYMDMLLVKIMENTPVLLEKNIMSCKPSK